ncbi:hypothetical protein [Streptomyces sp. NPDC002533]
MTIALLGGSSGCVEEACRIIGHAVHGGIDSSSSPDAPTPAELTPEQYESALGLVRHRGSGTPLALLLGHERFLSADYEVARGVLVPHPVTELLALASLELAANATRR